MMMIFCTLSNEHLYRSLYDWKTVSAWNYTVHEKSNPLDNVR